MIIITGGSWAVGEWQFNKLAGPGIAHYFSGNDHSVINLSQSGISNIRQVEKISELLKKFTPDQDDIFYWIVHSPLVGVPTQDIYQNKTNLTESISAHLHDQLQSADTLAKQYDITINLIGATCDLNTVDIDQFTNLKIVVPSWGQLLDSSYPTSIFGHQTDHMTELKQALIRNRPDMVSEYNTIGGMAFSKRRLMMRFPDMYQSFHPTSLAHKVLSNYLMDIKE